jgi:hypothetical protein
MKKKRRALTRAESGGPPDVRRCGDAGGKTKDGKPCRAPLGLGDNGLCMNHDPSRQAEAREVRAAGGVAAGAAKRAARVTVPGKENVPLPPKTLDDAVKFASWLTHAVCVGTLDARSAHEAGYSLNVFKAAVEKRDLQREIAALRAELAAARKETPTSKLGVSRG